MTVTRNDHDDASSDMDEPMASQSAGDSEAGGVGLRHNSNKSNFFSPSSGGNSSGDERAGMLQPNSGAGNNSARGSFKNNRDSPNNYQAKYGQYGKSSPHQQG